MGKNSAISWTDNTFNPWWGCEKVSPGCAHCYAQTLSNRFDEDIWGRSASRKFMTDKYWNQPLNWEKQAIKEEHPITVFCGSMCDVLEDREDLIPHRQRLWNFIPRTPHLRWLFLTKRPENFLRMLPIGWIIDGIPNNVWLGTSIETQHYAEERLGYLGSISANRFLSLEPLLGPVEIDYQYWGIDWVIVGGESGPNCRPMDLKWARVVKEGCQKADIPFFFKQTGGHPDKGHDMDKWPEDLQCQELPTF